VRGEQGVELEHLVTSDGIGHVRHALIDGGDLVLLGLSLEDDLEARAELEAELQKFETWVETVRPFLTSPHYLETATYNELRSAVKILGVQVTVFPSVGEWEYRYQIAVTIPEVMKKLHCFSTQP